MARVLQGSNGIQRGADIATLSAIYDQDITIVESTPGANELQTTSTDSFSGRGIIPSNTPITLPSGQTYNSSELKVYLKGKLIYPVLEYTYIGGIPRTQIQFLFDLYEGDVIKFKIERDF